MLHMLPTDALRLVAAAADESLLPLRETCRAFREAVGRVPSVLSHQSLVVASAQHGCTSLLLWAVERGYPGAAVCEAAARAKQLPVLRALRAAGIPWDARTYRRALLADDEELTTWVRDHGCPRPCFGTSYSMLRPDGVPMVFSDLPPGVRLWAAPFVHTLGTGLGGGYRFVNRFFLRRNWVGWSGVWQVQMKEGRRMRTVAFTTDHELAGVLAAAAYAVPALRNRHAMHEWVWFTCLAGPRTFAAWVASLPGAA
jgi:hypothetical protein